MISNDWVKNQSRRLEHFKSGKDSWARPPTLALKLALSPFGRGVREGWVPMGFFACKDIQIYIGLPFHALQRLLSLTGHTTSRKIVDAVFPDFRKKNMPFDLRYKPKEGLPRKLVPWLDAVTAIVKRIKMDKWSPPPVCVLNITGGEKAPRIVRSEHLCGQVPDGTHRVLAYTMLGTESPEKPVPVRVLEIHPAALAAVNIATISLRFMMDPIHTPSYIKKRFDGPVDFQLKPCTW